MRDDLGEIHLYDGRRHLGGLKQLSDGTVEAFIADADGRLSYLAKAVDRKEAAAMIHAHAARLGRAQEQEITESRRATA